MGNPDPFFFPVTGSFFDFDPFTPHPVASTAIMGRIPYLFIDRRYPHLPDLPMP
jgi:hypothetical protein